MQEHARAKNAPRGESPKAETAVAPGVMDPRTRLREHGISIKDWADSRGFNVTLVYAVIRGQRKCLRGQSYEIAKELGMK
jgi:gp16 family phage-associated protein